LKSSR